MNQKSSPGGLKFIFRSLKYTNYRLFFGGQSLSLIGTWMQRIAMPWLVYHITNSATLLGIVGFAGQIPAFLLAPFAGAIIDRSNKYHILIITQILATIQAIVLALLFFTGSIQTWHIIALSILLGCINAFEMPARQSLMVEMIEKKEDLGNAIALNSSIVNAARLLGPSIGGILIAVTNEGACFLFNAISYVFVIISLFLMKVKVKPRKKHDTRILKGIKEGFIYAFGFAPIRAILLLIGFISLMGMPYTVVMPIIAKEILHGDSHTFGFLMGASGIGALISSIYMASRKNILVISKISPLSAAIFGTGIILLSLSNIFWLSLGIMLIIGFGMLILTTSSNTILQNIVDDDKRGRVMSIYTMSFMGSSPLGSLLTGKLADTIGAPKTLLISGISCIVAAIIFANYLPSLKQKARPAYMKLGIFPEVTQGIQTAALNKKNKP